MDVIDEKKVKDVIVDPLVNRLLNEVLPAFDKLLQSIVDQIKDLKVSIQMEPK